jgi:acetyl-CoA acetyltransferase
MTTKYREMTDEEWDEFLEDLDRRAEAAGGYDELLMQDYGYTREQLDAFAERIEKRTRELLAERFPGTWSTKSVGN